ncbi:MAG: hypothetical protein OEM00_03135 [Burkholderiaceae bacterium]|nr:hypothetical protein [Burkholderiaceae bacterium]
MKARIPSNNADASPSLVPRPLRIEFPDAVYRVTARGDRREVIYADGEDRARFLAILAPGLERFDARLLAYCNECSARVRANHWQLTSPRASRATKRSASRPPTGSTQ